MLLKQHFACMCAFNSAPLTLPHLKLVLCFWKLQYRMENFLQQELNKIPKSITVEEPAIRWQDKW